MGTAAAPLAVGTRGTVGSLLKREIEYYRRLELDKQSQTLKRPEKQPINVSDNNGNRHSRSNSLGYLLTSSWRRKKRRSNSSGSDSFFPNLCSTVEVTDSSYSLDGIPGFSYRNLREEMEENIVL
ncbi:hypothetical protein Nepgr_007162 [Nepenthes gracilis]|uniref:Uncharacterized protein n=1 Tax=Nepenthes gracilis TaxID=150966 RepID=A0AAD3XI07_NEPGR|nr:hypothetical protein Nepgr_007162 [Nepenthes gracilis]